ncbi:MAG: hypothetical protein WAX80_01040 [Minisyncoccia bacterium]
MKDTEAALKWIAEILIRNKITFQVTGGFAAKLYGSNRELADIDIDVKEDCFELLLPEVKPCILSGPQNYLDEEFDVKLMTLEYRGQVIDIAGKAKIFDKNKKQWVELKPDFSNGNYISIYGIRIPVITQDALIEYKSMLLRDVDKEDIRVLTNNAGSNIAH